MVDFGLDEVPKSIAKARSCSDERSDAPDEQGSGFLRRRPILIRVNVQQTCEAGEG